jgi:methenyltetrahydromethanopterin cyclohydrolase
MVSVNKNALDLVEEMVSKREELKVKVSKLESNATVVDAGVKCDGSIDAGIYMTEICMGGLGKCSIMSSLFGDVELPSVSVYTDYPAIALLASQFAGWRVSVGKYFGMGSGPARALALKPKELYEKIGYKDKSDVAVLVLESDSLPNDEVAKYIAKECGVDENNLYLVVAPTSSPAGSLQISGRIVETGLHKLSELGIDLSKVKFGIGKAPIAPIHPKSVKAMGRTNDMILYSGITYFCVDYEDEEKLKEIVKRAPSSKSTSYGKPFYDTFKDVGFDFYKIDPHLFAPAVVMVNNIRTGNTFKAGKINVDVLKQSIAIEYL